MKSTAHPISPEEGWTLETCEQADRQFSHPAPFFPGASILGCYPGSLVSPDPEMKLNVITEGGQAISLSSVCSVLDLQQFGGSAFSYRTWVLQKLVRQYNLQLISTQHKDISQRTCIPCAFSRCSNICLWIK